MQGRLQRGLLPVQACEAASGERPHRVRFAGAVRPPNATDGHRGVGSPDLPTTMRSATA